MKVSITGGGRRGIDLEIVRLRLSRRTYHRFARCDTLTPAHVCSAALNGVASAYSCRRMPRTALDRLLAAVLAEQRRRGKKVPASDKSPRKTLVKVVAPPLALGKLNAIRAAFEAGFTPSRIARQFRISQSDVKKALASDEMKR